ncbi:MAG: 3' terminal RNA ribose 2'-O-methyltransferase Hen1 [Myxococcota bacterium]
MLLTISTTHQPATDLGYLLAKNPARTQTYELPFGHAHVFYPVADEQRCSAALLLDLDPLDLVKKARRVRRDDGLLTQYVNDRPYVASSFMSVAIAQVFRTALSGRSREREELAHMAIPLEAVVSALPSRGGEALLRRLFEPLGYDVAASRAELDPMSPDWGGSPYWRVGLRRTCPLKELLTHLYVLIPVLDDNKHYWVGDDEVEKLLAKGKGWLESHPAREEITTRYLRRNRRLTRTALARLMADDDLDPDDTIARSAREEDALEKPLSLNEQRLGSVVAALKGSGAATVVDVGCGEGKLLHALMKDRTFRRVVGMDVSVRALEIAKRRLRLDDLPSMQRERLELFQGSVTYRDARLQGFDAACAIEVIEHIDASRLDAFSRVLFEYAAPKTIVVTTPNREYNDNFESLAAGDFRHPDHRFEWRRDEFEAWGHRVAERFGYSSRFLPVGPSHAETGSPTQMGVFSR